MMRLLAIFRISLRALLRNPLRTLLTMLGVIIGVGSVIAMVSIGNGAKSQVEAQIAAMGQNVIMVFSGSFGSRGASGGFGSSGTLKVEDAVAIRDELEGVLGVSPEVRINAQVTYGNQNWNTNIAGQSDDYFAIRSWEVVEGAAFGEAEVAAAQRVAVIGQTVAVKIFEDPAAAVGQTVRIRGVPFIITGLLAKKGSSMFGSDQDDVIIVPYTTVMRRLSGVTSLRAINVSALRPDLVMAVADQITDLLRQRHRIGEGREDDFAVRTQQELTETATSTSKIMTGLLAAIASVSLVVGGIGIMNIMLVSVTERTREIGIRLAVGAKRRDILMQFLIESINLSAGGGAIGVGLGILSSKIISEQLRWPVLTPADAIVQALGVSAVVGIVFGLYPAWRASRLDPIEALRYE